MYIVRGVAQYFFCFVFFPQRLHVQFLSRDMVVWLL